HDHDFVRHVRPVRRLDQQVLARDVAPAVGPVVDVPPLVAIGDPGAFTLRARDGFDPDVVAHGAINGLDPVAVAHGAVDRLNPYALLAHGRGRTNRRRTNRYRRGAAVVRSAADLDPDEPAPAPAVVIVMPPFVSAAVVAPVMAVIIMMIRQSGGRDDADHRSPQNRAGGGEFAGLFHELAELAEHRFALR